MYDNKTGNIILTKNPCYTAGRKIDVKGLMLHSVGCPQPRASAFINSWNSPTFDRACVHGFIDGNDGTVYQTLPWNHRGCRTLLLMYAVIHTAQIRRKPG